MSVKERLKEFAKFKEKSVSLFEKKVGFSNGYINAIRVSIQPDKIQSIASKYPDLNITWLLTGEGSMLKNKSNADEIELAEDTIICPLVSQYAYAGYMRGFSDPIFMHELPTYTARMKHSKGNYIAVEVRGDSMNDNTAKAILNGDVILCRELIHDYWKTKLYIPKVFVIVHKHEGITIKEVIKHDVEKGIITCHSWNNMPEYEDFDLDMRDIYQMFYIKEITRTMSY